MTNQELDKKELVCKNCGADLKFEASTTSLSCGYCGAKNTIEISSETIDEIDYKEFIAGKLKEEEKQEVLNVKCKACGAEITFKPNITSDECPFCGSSIIVS